MQLLLEVQKLDLPEEWIDITILKSQLLQDGHEIRYDERKQEAALAWFCNMLSCS